MYMFFKRFFFTLLLGINSLAFAIDYPDEYDSQPALVYYGQAEWQITDEDLTKMIEEKLKLERFAKKYEQVTVNVEKSKVTVEGFVKEKQDRKELEKELEKMKGIKELYNRIEVQK